jgi:hypothetical protein
MGQNATGQNATAYWETPAGVRGQGPADPNQTYEGLDDGTPAGQAAWNAAFGKRYGGVPRPPEVAGMPRIGREPVQVNLGQIALLAYRGGWRPEVGEITEAAPLDDFDAVSLYDMAYTLVELKEGENSPWWLRWKSEWDRTNDTHPSGPHHPFPPGSFEELVGATKHWDRTIYWSNPAAAGRELELFDMVVSRVRLDPTPDLASLDHGPALFQPSLVLGLVDRARALVGPGGPVGPVGALPGDAGAIDFTFQATPGNKQALADLLYAAVPDLKHVGTGPCWDAAVVVFDHFTLVPKAYLQAGALALDAAPVSRDEHAAEAAGDVLDALLPDLLAKVAESDAKLFGNVEAELNALLRQAEPNAILAGITVRTLHRVLGAYLTTLAARLAAQRKADLGVA